MAAGRRVARNHSGITAMRPTGHGGPITGPSRSTHTLTCLHMFGFLKKALKPGDASAPVPDAAAESPAAPLQAPVSTAAAPSPVREQEKKRSWMDRLRSGLSRTREQIGGGLRLKIASVHASLASGDPSRRITHETA